LTAILPRVLKLKANPATTFGDIDIAQISPEVPIAAAAVLSIDAERLYRRFHAEHGNEALSLTRLDKRTNRRSRSRIREYCLRPVGVNLRNLFAGGRFQPGRNFVNSIHRVKTRRKSLITNENRVSFVPCGVFIGLKRGIDCQRAVAGERAPRVQRKSQRLVAADSRTYQNGV
jgi:hypothetical protein